MRKILMLFSLVLLASAALAQVPTGCVQFMASGLHDSSGNLISGAKLYLTPTTTEGVRIGYRSLCAVAGQTTTGTVTATVSNGAVSVLLPDVSQTSPKNVCFAVMVKDSASGNVLLNKGYECVQPHATATDTDDWCQSSVCDFDNYSPDLVDQETEPIVSASLLSGSTLAANVIYSSLTSVGDITSGTWDATTIAVTRGGTGTDVAPDASGELLIAQSVSAYAAKALSGDCTLAMDGVITCSGAIGTAEKYTDVETARAETAEASLSAAVMAAQTAAEAYMDTEAGRAQAAEAALGVAVTAAQAAAEKYTDAETARAEAAEASLGSAVTAAQVASEAYTDTETARAKAAESELGASAASAVASALSTAEAYTDSETGRAEAAEASLGSAVTAAQTASEAYTDTETARAKAAESALGTSAASAVASALSAAEAYTDTEESRATAAEASLGVAVSTAQANAESYTDAETARAKTAEAALSSLATTSAASALSSAKAYTDTETTRSEAAEATLTSSVAAAQSAVETYTDAETTRAKAAESALGSAVTSALASAETYTDAETSRAKSAEVVLTAAAAAAQTTASAAIPSAQIGVANGVAKLDSSGVLVLAELPAVAVNDVYVVASQAAMLALDASQGDVAVRTDTSSNYILAATPASTLANWVQLETPPNAVTSVQGMTGAVNLSATFDAYGAAAAALATAVAAIPSASTTTPAMDGTASAGSATTWARADHVHPTDTTRQVKITATGILKGDGSGGVTAAVSGSDFQAVLSNPVTGPGSGVVAGHLAAFSNTSGTAIIDGGAVPTLSSLGAVSTSTTVNGHALSSNVTVSASDVGLGNVSNAAQTLASVVPNTTPASGQILVGNSGGTAYAPVGMSGDCSLTATGAITCTKSSGTSFGSAAFTASSAYDAAGAASAVLGTAETYSATQASAAVSTAEAYTTSQLNSGSTFAHSVSGASSSVTSLGAVTAYTTSNPPTGLTMGEDYSNGYPTTYGNVINMRGSYAAGESQILLGWSDTSGANATNYVRSQRDSCVNNSTPCWSSWAALLDSVNYTSYAPSLTGTGANGTWGINVSGSASYLANYSNPVTTNTGNSWPSLVSIKGDGVSELGSILDFHASSADASDYLVRLTASSDLLTISNQLMVNESINTASTFNSNGPGTNVFTNTVTSSLADVLYMWAPNTTGKTRMFLGRDGNTYDAAILEHVYAGAQSSGNYLGLGFYNAENLVKIYGTGNVSVSGNMGIDQGLTVGEGVTAGSFSGAGTGLTGTASSLTAGAVSSISSSQVTTALGYTPYNSSNPSGYITSSSSITGNAAASDRLGMWDASNYYMGSFTATSRSTFGTPNQYQQSVSWEFKDASAVGGSGNYAGVMTFAPWLGTTASTGDPDYQLAFTPASANSTSVPTVRVRAGIDSTWGSWATLLSSANYNSYSPTLTGGNASGTWGISVSGTAASLSSASALPAGTTATTQSAGDTSTAVATDAFVSAAITSATASISVPVRQTVLSGPQTSSVVTGAPTFLPSTSTSLTLTAQNISSSAPLIVTAAQGFSSSGAVNYVYTFTGAPSWTLTASTTNYLYVNASTGATGVTTLAPVYQFEGTPSTTSGQFTFNISEMMGYLGNGSSAVATPIVIVGEAVAGTSTVTSSIAYAYNGRYVSALYAWPSSGSVTSMSHALGVGPGAYVSRWVGVNTTAVSCYPVNSEVPLTFFTTGSPWVSYFTEVNYTRIYSELIADSASSVYMHPGCAGSMATTTTADWNVRVYVTRTF